MLRVIILIGFLLTISIGWVACHDKQGTDDKVNNPNTAESLIKTNRYMVKSENEEINSYIRRHQLEMIETGSGLRYIKTKEGTGPKVVKGQWVELEYTLSLITGDVLYSSEESGTMSFKTGRGGVENGLEEAVLLLHGGDKAKLIIPSHLAHGLLGDDNKIPARSTVIYNIEIINIK